MRFCTDLTHLRNPAKTILPEINSSRKNKANFSIENIDDPCMTNVAVNPKEYHESFKSENVNNVRVSERVL